LFILFADQYPHEDPKTLDTGAQSFLVDPVTYSGKLEAAINEIKEKHAAQPRKTA